MMREMFVNPSLALLFVALAAPAEQPADKPFVVRAIVGGQMVVDASKLATSKGGPKVKPLAEKLVADHEQFNTTLLKLAEERKIHPPQAKTERHRRTLDRLSNLSGGAFDRAFADAIAREHNNAIALFKRQVEYGKDEELKMLALDRLPMLESHLKASRELYKQLAAAATTTSRPAK